MFHCSPTNRIFIAPSSKIVSAVSKLKPSSPSSSVLLFSNFLLRRQPAVRTQQQFSHCFPLLCCSSPQNFSSFRFSSTTTTTTTTTIAEGTAGAGGDDFTFDATAAIAKDAENLSQQERIDRLVKSLLQSAIEKYQQQEREATGGDQEDQEQQPPVIHSIGQLPLDSIVQLQTFFNKEPINDCIQCERVVVTHVQNEKGEDTKMKMPEMSLEEAIEQAKENKMDLVQVAKNKNVAYCRLRDAKGKAMSSIIQPQIEAAAAALGGFVASSSSSSSSSAVSGDKNSKSSFVVKRDELKLHTFRDAADSHFCKWKGKKIASELAKAFPVKLQILQFISPQSASTKMQEMLESIKKHSEVDEDFESGLHKTQRPVVGQHSNGIQVSEKELAVQLTPTGPGNVVKHPSVGDWKNATKRHEQLCSKADRRSFGTVHESKHLNRKNVGARTFRVDKFGRRLD